MKYKRVAVTSIVLIIILVIIISYFGFASLAASFGYSKTGHRDKASPTASIPKPTVIIDAGHGGIDPGAVDNGLVEKDLNLKVAEKLKAFLSIAGVDTLMTRSDDSLLGQGETVRKHKTADLKERLNILNAAENCVFVSIHMNKFSSASARGLQAFYASASSDANVLAENIQEFARLLDPSNKRQIKPDGKTIYILENTNKTAVLVECGFISNAEESRLLASDEYQNKLAFAIYCGIIKYLQER